LFSFKPKYFVALLDKLVHTKCVLYVILIGKLFTYMNKIYS